MATLGSLGRLQLWLGARHARTSDTEGYIAIDRTPLDSISVTGFSDGAALGRAVIPDYNVAWFPAPSYAILGRGEVRLKAVKQLLARISFQADEVPHGLSEHEQALARLGMDANNRTRVLADGSGEDITKLLAPSSAECLVKVQS